MPDMLTIKSAFSTKWLWSPFDVWPSTEMARSVKTAIAVLSMKPSGCTPALSAAMMSDAPCRAMASAIWLRTQFPTQTKRIFTGAFIRQDPFPAMRRKYS